MITYAVCLIKKIKTWAQLSTCEKHNTRARETPNADLSVKNIRLIDSANGASDKTLKVLFMEKIGAQKIRSNAVLGIEMVLSASPQYFRPENPSQAGFYLRGRVDDFADACTDWLLNRYYNRVVCAELHLDETTPHIHAFIVPLDNQGKLNARAIFHGRHKLSELQDSFACAVSHLGIERGIKGSKAKHTDIQKYYAAVNCKSFHINLNDVLPKPSENESAINYRVLIQEILQPQLDILNNQLADRDLQLREKKNIEQTAIESERERQKLEQRVQNLAWTLELWQAQANLLRDLPLEEVAYHLGLHLNNKGNWEGYGHTIKINGAKFYDYSGAQYGGGGAIDLAMHLLQCNFRQAVAWLHDIFGESEMLRAVTHHARMTAQEISIEEAPQFVPPLPDNSRWDAVKDYLVATRKLPTNLIDNLHTAGLIYSDPKQNAVFVMRSWDGEVTGAFLRGTYGYNNTFYGLAKNSKRNKGWFHFTAGGQGEEKITRAVLALSPIEALSVAVLDQELSEKTIYIAVDSPRCMPVEFLSYFKNVVAAYDNDTTGEEIAGAVKKILPQTTRLKPSCSDWNQQLILMR
ncbi:plasmid recombination enzyme [Calothrix sp. PCC 7716]|nr:plasmid recombination enzyme [Calothrix sp. PCC 7716]